MNYMREAITLVNDHTGLTVANFERLIGLREQAKGEESAMIGKLVEAFIMQAPPDVLKQIVAVV
ncbi:MAG: hypothetical protein ICV77_06305 [Cyanobacteria bacterium Co-bin8]|nr:hypothetical protein [Cyanobacteria bacterium Co-bin8]